MPTAAAEALDRQPRKQVFSPARHDRWHSITLFHEDWKCWPRERTGLLARCPAIPLPGRPARNIQDCLFRGMTANYDECGPVALNVQIHVRRCASASM